jgi:hypothetical protein
LRRHGSAEAARQVTATGGSAGLSLGGAWPARAPPQQDEQRRQSQFDRHEQQEEGVRRANHQPGERAASAADKGTRTAQPV